MTTTLDQLERASDIVKGVLTLPDADLDAALAGDGHITITPEP